MFEKSFSFLHLIKDNNNREWFHANKKLYLEAKLEFEHFTELLINETATFDKDIKGLLPKNCIFRIFRDVRFSADKSPYKPNFGSFLCKGGRNSGNAGYYLHLEPNGSFIAGGIYMPPSPVLRAIREDVYEHIDEFKEIISSADFIRHFKTIDANKLKTAPKGFPKDFPDIELLKFTSYTVGKGRTDKQISGENMLEEILDAFKSLYSFNRFLNEATSKVQIERV
jgi:uncharacterized protein (TIGR02453 family)